MERLSGVVIEPGDGLGVGSVREPDVSEIGLPRFVRERCLEPDVAAFGFLLRVRFDQTRSHQPASDRRHRYGDPEMIFEVPLHRHRPSIQPLLGLKLPVR